MLEVDVPVLVAPRRPMEMQRLQLDAPRFGEVRVRMVASGVCHSCLHAADGSHAQVGTPIVLGDEGAGVVDAVGPGCTQVRPGDHVVISWAPGCGACRHCAGGRPGLCLNAPPLGYLADGTTRFHRGDDDVLHYGPATYSPFTVVPERAAIPVPREIPLELAALIGCCVTTGCGAALNTAAVRPGQSVAVLGCGGVGLNAVQGAALAGASPIVAVDPHPAKLRYAEQLGATLAVAAADGGVADEILRLVPGGVDAAIVAVGDAEAVEQAWSALAPGGVCVLVGNPPSDTRAIAVAPHWLLGGERRLVGSVYGSSNPAVDFPRYAHLYLAGRLKLDELVTRRYALDEADEAFADLAAGRLARGLIVF